MLLAFQLHRKSPKAVVWLLLSPLVSMVFVVLLTHHMTKGKDTTAACPFTTELVGREQLPDPLTSYYRRFGMHKSLVAKGNRVPQLFPGATIFVVLVQGLQVRCQDQTSERHTYMVLVWRTLEHLQGRGRGPSPAFGHIGFHFEAWNYLNCSYDATF